MVTPFSTSELRRRGRTILGYTDTRKPDPVQLRGQRPCQALGGKPIISGTNSDAARETQATAGIHSN
jgi:hypothetical protein